VTIHPNLIALLAGSLLRRDIRQPPPVPRDAVAGRLARQRKAVLDLDIGSMGEGAQLGSAG
jgi:hypothetical protein